jgi:hypothetical protein
MKKVISWKTMSRIGVRFGSALSLPCDPDISNSAGDEFQTSFKGAPAERASGCVSVTGKATFTRTAAQQPFADQGAAGFGAAAGAAVRGRFNMRTMARK